MTLDELYNLSKEEGFKRIKEESRSHAKRNLLLGAGLVLICIILIILFLFPIEEWQKTARIIRICQDLFLVIGAVWSTVNNYRFLQCVEDLNTPEKLLYWYEKKLNNDRKAYYLVMLTLTCNLVDPYSIARGEWGFVSIELIIAAAMLAYLIYSYFKSDTLKYKTNREEEILDRLHDLIDMK